MVTQSFDQSKQLAVGVTFLVCLLLLFILLFCKLGWALAPSEPPEGPKIVMSEFEEEFIDVDVEVPPVVGQEQNAPSYAEEDVDNESQPGPQSGVNLNSQGKVGDPAQTVTTAKPSTVKEQQKPTPDKNSAAIQNQKDQANKALAEQTNNKVKNVFANAQNKNNSQNGTKDNGPSASNTGNPNSSANKNAKGTTVGVTGTIGGKWKIPNYSRSIPSNENGSVTFEVQVRKDGSVGKVTQTKQQGLSSATISRCKSEIQSKKFTNTNMATAEPATAYITFTFTDPK